MDVAPSHLVQHGIVYVMPEPEPYAPPAAKVARPPTKWRRLFWPLLLAVLTLYIGVYFVASLNGYRNIGFSGRSWGGGFHVADLYVWYPRWVDLDFFFWPLWKLDRTFWHRDQDMFPGH